MKKEDLMALGLTEEQAKKVMDSLDGNFVTKARFNEVNEENKTLKQSISERDNQLETLKNSVGDNETLKKKIADLQKENEEQKTAHKAEMAQLRLDNAVENALMAAGAKNSKAAKSLIDMSKVKLGEDGKLTGFSEQLEAVQKSDSYLFAEKQQNKQNFKGFQPGASGDVKPNTKVDTTKMSYDELCAYLEKNPDTTLN